MIRSALFRVLLLGLTLGAFALRVFHLAAQSFWYDEAFSVYISNLSLGEITARTAADIQPPLYYYLLHFWMLIAGDSEFAVRFVSLAFGVLTVPLLYVVAKKLFDARVGLFAALLASVSALYLWYSQEARMYSLITFLGLLSSYFLLRALAPSRLKRERLRGEGWGWWLAFALTNAAALYTHYFAATIIAFQFLFALLVWLRSKPSTHPESSPRSFWGTLRPYVYALLAFVGTFVAFLPWVPFVLARLGEDASYWRGDLKMDEAIRHIFLNFALGESVLEDLARQITPWWLVILLVGLVAWMLQNFHHRDAERTENKNNARVLRDSVVKFPAVSFGILYLVVPLALLLFLFSRNPKFNARYLMIASPGFFLLLAVGMSSWLALVARGRILARVFSALVLILSFGFLLFTSYTADANAFFDPAFTKADFRGVAQYISAHAQPDDAIILTSGHMFPAFDYYYHGDLTELRLPDDPTLNTEHVLNASIANDLNRALAGKRGVWLVAWQDDVVDPNGFVPYMLSTRAREQNLGAAFWQIKLRYWSFDANPASFASTPKVQFPHIANFKNQVKLLGLSVPAPTSADVGASFVLHWQALATFDDDYLVSLRVLDAQGNQWGKLDRRPAGFNYPTMRWKPNEYIIGNYTVPLLPGAPAGDYSVVVTFYTLKDQTGLDILASNGAPLGRSVTLGPIRVLPAQKFSTYLDLKIQNTVESQLGPFSLIGYAFGRDQASAGETIPLTLFWRADQKPDADYQFRLAFGNSPTTFFPLANAQYPTSQWRAGEIVRGQYLIPIPANASAGANDVKLELNRAGNDVGASANLATFTVEKTDRVFTAPSPQFAQRAIFGDHLLSLVGYDLSANTIRAGDPSAGSGLTVTLYWNALNKMDKPYTVFVHLLDKDSKVAAQRDAQPLNGVRPTPTWVSGEYLADAYTLDLKPDAPAGDYQIEIGWYDASDPSFARLQALDDKDNPIGDRVVLSQTLVVSR